MPCYAPITAWYSRDVGVSGKRGITFRRDFAYSPASIKLPCGKCVGCRLEKSRQWAVRCMHEKKMHDKSAFVTLSYEEKYLPEGMSLCKRDLQLFMKRLRKHFGRGIRFYACGEYGDHNNRPHYHLLFFNLQFEDMTPVGRAKAGQILYTSKVLRDLWPFGFNFIGEVTFDSCAYVARYIMKKVSGDVAESHYQVLTSDGEIIDREPEFTVMSRRPGIGAGWFDRYHSEVYSFDTVITNGREAKPPRFYDLRFELLDAMRLETLKKVRRRKALMNKADNTLRRLRVRETVELRKLAFYKTRVL